MHYYWNKTSFVYWILRVSFSAFILRGRDWSIGAIILSLIWTDFRFWITRSTGVVRDWEVVASFISMDLIYENLTFHGILFLVFSILKLSHPVTNALELLSFLTVQKLHVITFFLFSYFNKGRPFFRLSQKLLFWKHNKYRFKSLIGADLGLKLRWTTFEAINWCDSDVCCIFSFKTV